MARQKRVLYRRIRWRNRRRSNTFGGYCIYLIFSIENYAFERMNKERLNGFHRSRGESLNRVRAMTNEPKSLSIGYSNVQSSFLKDTDEEDKPKQLVKGVRRMPSSDVSHVVPKTRDPFNSARISVCGPDGGKKPFRSFRLVLSPKKNREKRNKERETARDAFLAVYGMSQLA